MTEQKLPPLHCRITADELPEQRFLGDLYAREKLAAQLTGFLLRMPDGGVMAIDSPWGEGKTWFGKRWCASLGDAGFQTAYIDCFQRDHLDDPFTMIAGEFIELAKAGKPELKFKLLETGKKLGAALLPAATKFAINAIGHWAIGNAHLVDNLTKSAEAFDASAAVALEKLVATHLADYQASKKSLDAFRQTLTELSIESEKPIIIFLDELDRCRPDFAVKTIERMKHFFDAPGIIFILLLNRRQLAAAVEGLYGPKVDANAYLSKFIPISLTLPKRLSLNRHGDDDNRRHCDSELCRFGFKNSDVTNGFASVMSNLATAFAFSLRDVEHAIVLYSLAQPVNAASSAIAWPIAIKLHRPDLYKRLCHHDVKAHAEAKELAITLQSTAGNARRMLSFFEALHDSGMSQFKQSLSADTVQTLSSMSQWSDAKEFLSWLFSRIDLTVAQ